MIVVDTSAIVAVRLGEPERSKFLALLEEDPVVPASCLLEASIAIRRRLADVGWIDTFLRRAKPHIAPIDDRVVGIAREADRRYGRSAGHPARLNFGDCLAYAVAKHLDAPLLTKGDDFHHTDIRSAL